ncbi:hypothetical protein Q0590_25645 [Rhodocytophaga aerolata]|uniref:Uncharacterized protein n=1 Tax=Rhodocytophaga aerolata TaxID=455078 RepID=A0ABT8RC58_9BACT|nr:hypothetical protein [Rhodocytophaga aerolata]MDO1449687.1 hypothetical protein [Rhodocytophaga aerolata]
MIVIFSSCSNEDEGEKMAELSGKIKGMGKQPGEPEGPPFVVPPWFQIEEIRGSSLAEPEANSCIFDGTGEWMVLNVKFRNTEDEEKLLTIPAGTIIWPIGDVLVSTAHLYQGGIIIEKIVVKVPPTPSGSGGCNIKLLAYCINKSKEFSDPEMVYKFGNISNAPQIRNFLKLVEKKKLAYSAFDGSEPTAFSYGEITREIQEIIWNITDKDGLEKEDIEYLEKLPNK